VAELMKKWGSDIAYLADYDPAKEKSIQRIDIFTFYHNLSDRKQRNERNNTDLNSVPFGRD